MSADSQQYGSGLLRQIGVVGQRSVKRTLRQPAAIIPPIIFPLILLGISSAGLSKATSIPGFPADRYFDFLLVVPFMQGALFATTAAGLALGQDIEGGFLNRLALTPIRASALILGQMAGAAVLSSISATIYILVGLLAGVDFQSGIGGIVVLFVLAVATGVGFATIGAYFALRAGTAEAVQGLFPILFAALFLSTMNMPLDLIEKDWFHFLAKWNPVSAMIGGMRSLIIDSWDIGALWRDVAVLVALLTLGVTGSAIALRGRLTRT